MDDDDMIRDLAGKMASELGYEVEGARNGAEAVELYEAARRRLEPFDIVILDLTVPGAMGGRETAQRLREIDPNVKAIVSSGYSNDPILSDYKSYGFREVLAKPYTIRDVAQTLARLAENKS